MRVTAALLLLFSTLLITPVHAVVLVAEHSEARLLSSVSQAAPGQPLSLVLTITPREHWHLYWKNPGDSGARIITDWTSDADLVVGEARWPVPSRLPAGPLMNYGYDRATTWLFPVHVPDDAGEPLAIQLEAEWLVCDVECVPQYGSFDLAIPVGDESMADPAVSPIVDAARIALPGALPWPASARATSAGTELRITMAPGESAMVTDAYFFPEDDGLTPYAEPQRFSAGKDHVTLFLSGPTAGVSLDTVRGVLVLSTVAGPEEAFELETPIMTAGTAPRGGLHPVRALLLALLGGLILNVMPCVFPILSLKALSLAKLANRQPAAARRDGLAYTAGVIASFASVGMLLLVLQAGGAAVGWGFQLQSPAFVLLMATLMFAIGLNLAGGFELPFTGGGVGQSLTERAGWTGSFFTGVLATLVASPCTAPFMAAALGAALTQPAPIAVLIFICLGLGLALPYLAISLSPRIGRALPAPGPWMIRFRQLLAFPMFATAVWLLWVLGQQSSIDVVALALLGMVALSFVIWCGQQFSRPVTAALALVLLLGTTVILGERRGSTGDAGGQGLAYEVFSDARLAELRAAGAPVFVNFTAAWCITCQVNERVALSSQAVIEHFQRRGIRALKADWTNRDAAIADRLADHGRSGVPLYLFYPPDSDGPALLPQILTPDLVIRHSNG